jgi:hypothetical protein
MSLEISYLTERVNRWQTPSGDMPWLTRDLPNGKLITCSSYEYYSPERELVYDFEMLVWDYKVTAKYSGHYIG